MKKLIMGFLFCINFTILLSCHSQEYFTRKGYKLTFKSNYANLDVKLKNRLIETFFIVYPKLSAEYNLRTNKEVVFFVDTAYKGVAVTYVDGTVFFSATWMKEHPEDIDVVTHEVMHVVQNYGNSVGPVWLTEGIADYARYKFGIDNEGSKWTLPDLKPTHHYKNSYRITARFFVWIENKVKSGSIRLIDQSLRDHTYNEEIWKNITRKNLDELWADYTLNPIL